MLRTFTTGASSKVHDIFLPVSQAGMVVTVGAGPFKYNGSEHELVESWTYTATSEVTKTVFGWLALDGNGDAVVVMEEIPVDAPVGFQWVGSGYVQLHGLFQLVVPEGATDLDAVEIIVRHVGTPTEG